MAHVKPTLVLATAALSSLLATATLAASANIYKYVDKDGRTVYNASIPAEYARNGYTVLNDKGQVLQVVPRAPTEEEVAKQQASKEAEQKALANKVAQEENDKLLIRLYRSPEDVVKKRDAALMALKTQQDLTRNNLGKQEEEITRFQTVVDNNAKAGKEAPADTKKKLEQAKANKAKSDASLKKIEEDKAKLIADAARDFKRLRELLNMPAEPIPAPATESAEKSAAQ